MDGNCFRCCRNTGERTIPPSVPAHGLTGGFWLVVPVRMLRLVPEITFLFQNFSLVPAWKSQDPSHSITESHVQEHRLQDEHCDFSPFSPSTLHSRHCHSCSFRMPLTIGYSDRRATLDLSPHLWLHFSHLAAWVFDPSITMPRTGQGPWNCQGGIRSPIPRSSNQFTEDRCSRNTIILHIERGEQRKNLFTPLHSVENRQSRKPLLFHFTQLPHTGL